MDLTPIKTAHLSKLADYTRTLYRKPELRRLFFELTLQCNERCFHCGSSCTAAVQLAWPVREMTVTRPGS